MRIKFIGDPNNRGEGPASVTYYGLTFPKNQWVEVNEKIVSPDGVQRLSGNPAFAVEGRAPDTRQAPVPEPQHQNMAEGSMQPRQQTEAEMNPPMDRPDLTRPIVSRTKPDDQPANIGNLANKNDPNQPRQNDPNPPRQPGKPRDETQAERLHREAAEQRAEDRKR